MTDTYSVGRPLNREPYRGRYRTNRRTGERQVWNGTGYVALNYIGRLTTQEQQSRQAALDRARDMENVIPDLNRFEQLNRTVPTGSLSQRLGQTFGGLPRIVSIDNNATPQNEPQGYDEMRAINSRLAPLQREPGSGASSDTDTAMFREGLPSIASSGPANSAIIRGYRERAQEARDYADFLERYWPEHGSLHGVDQAYADYRRTRQSGRIAPQSQQSGSGADVILNADGTYSVPGRRP